VAEAGDAPGITVGKVFVPGGRPSVTYNPRPELGLERQVEEYLDERHRVLSVSGPTKTGKTTLLRSMLSDRVWVSGGEIRSLAEFWANVADRLGLYSVVEAESSTSGTSTLSAEISGGIPILSSKVGGEYGQEQGSVLRRSQTRPMRHSA
jgi:hypothetical protein